jgi:hypothetical protein
MEGTRALGEAVRRQAGREHRHAQGHRTGDGGVAGARAVEDSRGESPEHDGGEEVR